MRLYQLLTEKQLNKFLKPYNTNVNDEPLVEIKVGELFGDFICVEGFKFKYAMGRYQCLETPTQKLEKTKIYFTKAPNDRLK